MITTRIKALDNTGVDFQDNAGTSIMSMVDAGGLNIGSPASDAAAGELRTENNIVSEGNILIIGDNAALEVRDNASASERVVLSNISGVSFVDFYGGNLQWRDEGSTVVSELVDAGGLNIGVTAGDAGAGELRSQNDLISEGSILAIGDNNTIESRDNASTAQRFIMRNINGTSFLDYHGGGLRIRDEGATVTVSLSTAGRMGLGIAGGNAARMMELLHTIEPQIRLTHTAAVDFVDMQVDTNGFLQIAPSGSKIDFVGATDADVLLAFSGTTNSGLLSWMEDENYFQFSDDILMTSNENIYFGSTSNFIRFHSGFNSIVRSSATNTGEQLGDNAGAFVWAIADSDTNLVATINSNGEADFNGYCDAIGGFKVDGVAGADYDGTVAGLTNITIVGGIITAFS